MALHNIIHINIRVPAAELEACREFYCEFLGLQAGPRPPFTSKGFWLYADELPVVHLVADESKQDSRGHPALDHVAFRCTGLNATLEKLRARKIPYRISGVPTFEVIQVSFDDPVGIGIELSFEDAREIAAFIAAR